MPQPTFKFSLILLICLIYIGIQTFVSCTLNLDEETGLSSSSRSSSSGMTITASKVTFDNAPSSRLVKITVFDYSGDIKSTNDLSEYPSIPIGSSMDEQRPNAPVALTTIASEPFSQAGTFLVVVSFSSSTETRYYDKVTFVNGGARIDWSRNYFDGTNYISDITGGGSQSSSGGAALSSTGGSSSSSYTGSLSSSSDNGGSSSAVVAPSSGSTAVIVPVYGDPVTYEGETYETVVIGTQTWFAKNLNYKPAGGNHKCFAEGFGDNDGWLRPVSQYNPNDPNDVEMIEDNCKNFGRLYDWATAVALPANCNTTSCATQIQPKHQGICPSGWHIPSVDEWNELKNYVFSIIWENYEDEDLGWDVATKLKATTGWKAYSEPGISGVDSYGFKAIGTGYCVSCEKSKLQDGSGFYAGIDITRSNDLITKIEGGQEAHWWSSTEYKPSAGVTNPDAPKYAYKNKITYNKNTMTQEIETKAEYLYSVRCLKN